MLSRALLPLRTVVGRRFDVRSITTVTAMSAGNDRDPNGFKGFKRDNKQQKNKQPEQKVDKPSQKKEGKPQQKPTEEQQKKQASKEQPKPSAKQTSSTAGASTNQDSGSTGGPNSTPPNRWKAWQEWFEKTSMAYRLRFRDWQENYKFRYHHLLWLVLLAFLYPYREKYGYSEFLKQVQEQRVKAVTVTSSKLGEGKLTKARYVVDGRKAEVVVESSEQLLNQLKEHPQVEVTFDTSQPILQRIGDMSHSLTGIALLATIIMAFRVVKLQSKSMKGGGSIFDPSKKKFEMVKDVKTRFKDVAGLKESKFEVEEFVDFLRFPQKYKDVGARIPKGALLTGPPGTGKTMLAKACAGQAGVPFFFASGSDFVEMYVGVGAARIRELFKEAKSMSPSIIFIDEIDAVGRKRQDNLGSNDERDGTLNQLLVEMDGFGTDTKVIVMAATNRKELLDGALTRPGRFDRNIEINLPDLEGRWEIFMVHLSPLKLNPARTKEEYARRLATLTPGFSGAEIANICNEAAILAARTGKASVDTIDFEMATERVLGGVQRKSLVSQEERKVVAVHESGHGVVSWFLEGAFPLLKLTIIPRSKGALGFAQYLPKESLLESKEELIDRICFILGGRCAQQHFFKRITTGAYDDLQKAYQIAETLITKYGMSPKLSYMSFQESEYMKNYSDETGDLIDQEIKILIDRCTVITKDLIARHEDEIRRLSEALLKKESLDGKQILDILGNRPFEHHSSYRAYLQMQKQDELEKNQDKSNELPPPQPKPQ